MSLKRVGRGTRHAVILWVLAALTGCGSGSGVGNNPNTTDISQMDVAQLRKELKETRDAYSVLSKQVKEDPSAAVQKASTPEQNHVALERCMTEVQRAKDDLLQCHADLDRLQSDRDSLPDQESEQPEQEERAGWEAKAIATCKERCHSRYTAQMPSPHLYMECQANCERFKGNYRP